MALVCGLRRNDERPRLPMVPPLRRGGRGFPRSYSVCFVAKKPGMAHLRR